MWFIGIWISFQDKLLFLTLPVFWEVFQAIGKDVPEFCSLGGPLQILMIPFFHWKATNRYTQSHLFSAAAGTHKHPFRWFDQLPAWQITWQILGSEVSYFGEDRRILFLQGLKLKCGMRNWDPFFLNPRVLVVNQFWWRWAPRGGLEINHEWAGSSTTDTAAQLSVLCRETFPQHCWNTGSKTWHEWCRGLPLLARCQERTPFR